MSDLLRIPVADLEKKVEEHQFRKSELLVRLNEVRG